MFSYSNKRSFLGVFLLAFSMLFVFAACETEQEEMVEEQPLEEPLEEVTPDISDLEGDPLQYVGQTVRIDGEISEVYPDSVFTITGGLFDGDIPVIVTPNVTMPVIAEGDDVQVIGTVQAFVLAEIETDYGFDLDAEIETEIEENEPVIIAQTITPVME